jgi:hypothetical protein
LVRKMSHDFRGEQRRKPRWESMRDMAACGPEHFLGDTYEGRNDAVDR